MDDPKPVTIYARDADSLEAIRSQYILVDRKRLREKIIEGIRNAKAAGVEFGRPNLDIGKVNEILSYRGLMTHRQIAQKVGVSKGTVYRVLKASPAPEPKQQPELFALASV